VKVDAYFWLYKIIDFFLTKTHGFASEGLYYPLESCGLLFMKDGCIFEVKYGIAFG